jgi:hypothetical protein
MYYEVKVKLKITDGSGKLKKVTEAYFVDAVSCLDAETITSQEFNNAAFDWSVVSVKETKFVKVLPNV